MVPCRTRLVTMDETWLYHYDPETKQQLMEWWHRGSPRPKISECKNPLEKFSPRFFGIKTASSSKVPTINAEYYSSLLVQWKDILKDKRCGMFTKGVLFLHDNAPAYRALATQKKLAYLGFQCLEHPPYSPDLAPSVYHFFLWTEKTIERSPFFVRRGSHCCRGDLVGRTIFRIFFQ